MLPVVPVRPRHLSDYAAAAGDEAIDRLREAAVPLKGARLLQVNSTAFGGGVSELLHTHVPLLNDLGIETTWVLIEGSDEFYAVTKSIHNALQGAEHRLLPGMEQVYWDRMRANAPQLPRDFDFVLIHDPQPAALLTLVEEEGGRTGRWLWRCHIDLSAPYRPVWEMFQPLVNRFDAAIFTAEEFVQPGIDVAEIALIPPSIDPLSFKSVDMSHGAVLEATDSLGIDAGRPLLTQVSRFDPWKDPLGVIDSYRIVRRQVTDVQLVMIGSLANDDPEGMRYLELTNEHAGDDPDIHVLTNLDGVGDAAVNAVQRLSDVVIQKSLREGFGLVVAEAMWKGKPVVGGDVGGIRLQIVDGETGFLVGSVPECADAVTRLLQEPDLRDRMGAAGRERVRRGFLTVRELEDHVRLLSRLA
ncbi:MAG: glycosyltransferase [Actinomycetota bacterium]